MIQLLCLWFIISNIKELSKLCNVLISWNKFKKTLYILLISLSIKCQSVIFIWFQSLFYTDLTSRLYVHFQTWNKWSYTHRDKMKLFWFLLIFSFTVASVLGGSKLLILFSDLRIEVFFLNYLLHFILLN